MDKLSVWRQRFILETMLLFLKGKVNFLQLARYGTYDERSYRNGFEKGFDFLGFNQLLIKEISNRNRLLIIPIILCLTGGDW